MVGDRATAVAIAQSENVAGFKRLPGGGNRNVYTNGEVCYKVQTFFGSFMHGFGNRAEYDHARALRAQSDNGWIGRVYIPAVSGYSVEGRLIIAMEHIHGSPATWGQSNLNKSQEAALWDLFNLGFGDMHAANYMWLNGRKAAVAPVDMGSQRYRSNRTILSSADTRVLSGTSYRKKLDDHRDFVWRNRDRYPRFDLRGRQVVPRTCKCGCGEVAWWA